MTNGNSQLNIVINGNSKGALDSLDEVIKSIGDMTKTLTDFSKVAADVSKVVTDMAETIGKDFGTASKEMDGLSKTAADISKSISSLTKVTEEQTKLIDSSFEDLSKIVQDSGVSIATELGDMGKSVEDMAKTMDSGMTQMIDEMKTLVGETRNVTSAVNDMGAKSQVAGEKVGKAIDYAGLMIAGEQLKQFGEKIVGFFAASVKAGSEFSQTMANTRAALDAQPGAIAASNAEMTKMQKLALQIGSTGFYSANQVADAMSTLARNGLNASTIMQGAIQQTSNAAAANTADIGETATTLSDIYNELGANVVKQFKGNVPAAFEYLSNVMTRVLHSSKISMTDLFSTMRYAGSAASNAGMSFADLGGAISLLGSHAIRGSQAGTVLRRMILNLTPSTKAATAEMQKLGMITASGQNIFYNANGTLKSMTTIQQLLHDKLSTLTPQMQTYAEKVIFGTYALNGMSIIANESPAAFAKLTKSMATAGATMTALKDREQGWRYTFKRLTAEFQTIQKEIGLMLKPVVDKLTNALTFLMNAWDHLSGKTQKVIIGVVGAIGALSLIAGVVMTAMAGFGFLTMGLEAAGAAFAAVGTMALPIVAILAGVGVAVYELVKHWQTVKTVTETVWTEIQHVVTTVVTAIMSVVRPAITAVTTWWTSHFTEIQQVSTTVFRIFRALIEEYFLPEITVIRVTLSVFAKTWKDIWNTIVAILKLAWDTIVSVTKVTWDIFSGIIGVALDLLTGHWKRAWTDLKTTLINTWTDMKNGVGKIANDMGTVVIDAVHTLIDGVVGAFDGLVNTVKGVWNSIVSIFKGPMPTPQMPTIPTAVHAPNVPHFATGGIVTKPTLAVVGDGGAEAIVPLSGISQSSSNYSVGLPGTLARSGGSLGNTVQFNAPININVANGDANTIARSIKTQISRALA